MGWFNRKKASKNNTSKPELSQKDSSSIRFHSIAVCHDAGFQPASSLPTINETKLRPDNEIAGRLHAIKALVLWLMVPSENLPDEKILNFINQNMLLDFMTEEEKEILDASRNDIELRNSIGWKFENAWPLAWYFGYDEPEISGQMITGEQMQEILIKHTCSLNALIGDWLPQQQTIQEEELLKKEDLFYCLHNSVRSAQLGGDTVPNGFDPIGNGGVIHERRHSLTWMLSSGTKWEDTDLST
ncbi:DUF4272 domain-containing protein [Tenacibaculum sp. SDUM215027]|uniref:DUF4272 domain-containing protein n=1 Tax=Tenacibaculum sp. SDUM215027 TaxID=3422596 RepID=UPI003D313550